ncbi:diguanylate cyclase [Congregibacter variabilis]|uniref:diguanylate cyclase n=1 Tax=Congregibacter variabilis TaxID=3081200 RepID=A0ABZ0I1F3_9GAMM|nr:diguanylate cyclase [Congregibacter sp. IMCC43200]
MDKVKALEQLAIRLSHMADGVDEEVDALLVSIRKQLKDGGDTGKIENLSGRLARTMMANTGVNPDKGRTVEGGYDLSGLRKLIKTMPVRGDEQERMGTLVQQVASGTTSMARQKALVDLLGSAAEALREVATRDKTDSGVLGWLGKKSGGDGADDRYVALFVQLLQRLVEHIDVLNGNAIRSHAIKDSLEQAVHPEQAQKLLAEVTDEIETIDARIRAERNQTTDFLGDLRERLDGFEEVLNFLADDGDSSLKRSEELQSSVGEDTREMGEAAKSDDIVKVRSVIATGLTKLTQRLAEHVVSEREQHEHSKAKVAELNERLAHLEDEADILRSEIRNKNDLALKDALTGVYNRAGYDERTHELFARWQRSGASLSIVFVDCNKFKEINDTYGHTAGDLVLVKVADVLQMRARASDIVCRYGGDEFVILLPDTHVQGAEVFARSVCDEVLNAGFNDNGKPLDVSISCGVTELVVGDTLESAVGRADEAMYQAKKMDGIKVCVVK